MSKPMEKIIYESQLKCPWCSKLIRAKVTRMTIKPAVKGETATTGFFEKDTQTTIEEDFMAMKTKEDKLRYKPGDNLDDDYKQFKKKQDRRVIPKEETYEPI